MSGIGKLDRSEMWRRRFERYAQATGSVAEFCRREGVSQAAFYLWRKRLKIGKQRAAQQAGPSTQRGPGFVAVEVDAALMAARIEIALPGGAVVRLPCDASADVVGAAVAAAGRAGAAAEGASC